LRPEPELVVSVAQAHDNPYFNLVEAQPDGSVRLSKGSGAGRRQDTPEVYALNGSIYVWQRAALTHAAQHGLWSVRGVPYVMPRWKSVDIDTLEDFEYAEWLHARHAGGGLHAP
jgi:CMP-N,N'-diacetyllegionaminic acid synthase